MIKIASYNSRLHKIDVEFLFINRAIDRLSKSAKNTFFSELTAEEKKLFQSVLPMLPPSIPADQVDDIAALHDKQTREKYAPRNRRPYYETVEDGIRAAELLIRIALFEAFMKEVHAEVLRARPSLLAKISPKAAVKYEDIFTKPSFEAILNQEIHREVDRVDRLGFKKRADYFKSELSLPLGDTVAFVDEIMTTRNEISHENPFKTVPLAALVSARKALKKIPSDVCHEARKIYGEKFFS